MLISMCCYCTEENGKLKYLKETLNSLKRTVNWTKHRMFIIDNSPTDIVSDLLLKFYLELPCTITARRSNIGTAEGINIALSQREKGEFTVKCDDDWTTEHVGWADEMERVMTEHPEIGILGLRRDDVYGELKEDGELLWNSDIMGTCTMYNPLMLDKVGRLIQPSPQYGFDDNIFSARSEAAGFKNAYMKNIKITNLDEGGTEYTEWKKREAAVYLQEAGTLINMIKKGTISYYYPFE